MRDKIIEFARLNTENGSSNARDLHLLKLDSISDLDVVKDLMCDDAIESLTDRENRISIKDDINDGVTFIFWNDDNGKLEYSR